ncbi:MAG: histone deacetylase [Allosphingosinicella sp.]|uniref:histone deacetylase family protein n=1 Tax=Allosphingosinicella sp. TaxID=2823234 RepID=UPI00394F7104
MIAVVHHPDYVLPTAYAPTLKANKNALIRDAMLACGEPLEWIEPEPMPLDWLRAVHCPDYVDEVVEARVPAHKERRIGFTITPPVALRSQLVPGGTYAAALAAKERGFAANTGGGSHHALHDTGAGYCVFNDLALAAVRLVGEGQARRVLIVDCDVHQGDGTAALTAGYPDIATFSIHAERNFPVRKARSTLDVALPDGVEDDEYLRLLGHHLVPLVDAFEPDLILYQAGVDPLADDRLGRLSLTQDGIDRRDTFVATLAQSRRIPLASTPGGGYGPDLTEIARRHVRSIMTLGAVFSGPQVAVQF